MFGLIKKILKISAVAMVVPTVALSVQAPNPRGSSARNVSNTQKVVSDQNSSMRRSATSVIARSVSNNNRNKSRTVVTARTAATRSGGAIMSRAARKTHVVSPTNGANV